MLTFFLYKAKQKKVSASSNPTDRVLKLPTGHFFSTSRPIRFGAVPCVANCVVDRDHEREIDERKSSKGKEYVRRARQI